MKKEKCRKEKYRLARYLMRRIPDSLIRRWDQYLEQTFLEQTTSTKENQRRMKEFQLRQVSLAFWGIVSLVVMVLFLFLFYHWNEGMTFVRNPFGKGEKKITLQMENAGKKEEILFVLEEQKLSSSEEEKIFEDFFEELKQVMLGKNASAEKIDQPLDFPDELDGYPFFLSYEPEDMGLINWNGDLGEDALALAGKETRHTSIRVEAEYKDYFREKIYDITIYPPKKEKIGLFERIQNALSKKESQSRKEADFTVDPILEEVKISDPSGQRLWKLPILCLAILIGLLIRNHTVLKDQEKIRHKENMEDFPLIVHLLTLYMGAGLSFPSAVERIAVDYEVRQRACKPRFAFEQICLMNHVMHMGIRPKEACLGWGDHFQERVYAKFAMLLSQGLSKGAKEIRLLMEREQQDAFQVQIDHVRREGEAASTKLLFPMVVLLAFVMLVVMFPAMMQFYSMN